MNQLVKYIIEFEYILNPKITSLIESDKGLSVNNLYILCKKYNLPATREFIMQEADPSVNETKRVASGAINSIKKTTNTMYNMEKEPTMKKAIRKMYDAGKAVFSIIKEVSWNEALKFLKEFAKRMMGFKSSLPDTNVQIKPNKNVDPGVNNQRGREMYRISASDFDLQEYNKEAVRTVGKSYKEYQDGKGSSRVIKFLTEFFNFLMFAAKTIAKGGTPEAKNAAKKIEMQANKLKEG